MLPCGGTQGRLADSYDNMLQELSTEQEQLADYERILKKDSQMGDEAYKVLAQRESHKVSSRSGVLRIEMKGPSWFWNHRSYLVLFLF